MLILPGVLGSKGGGFDPASVWSLLWLADDGVTLVSGDVSQWADLVTGKIVARTLAAERPLYVESLAAANDQPALTFDGTDDYLTDGSGLDLGASSWTFAAVVTTSTAASGNERIVAQRGAGSGFRAGHRNSVLRASIEAENGETIFLDSTTAINDGGLHSVRLEFDGGTKTLTLFVDDAEEDSGSNALIDSISYANEFQIGAESGIRNWDGSIMAVAYRTDRRLTAAELSAFSDYALSKWGVAV